MISRKLNTRMTVLMAYEIDQALLPCAVVESSPNVLKQQQAPDLKGTQICKLYPHTANDQQIDDISVSSAVGSGDRGTGKGNGARPNDGSCRSIGADVWVGVAIKSGRYD